MSNRVGSLTPNRGAATGGPLNVDAAIDYLLAGAVVSEAPPDHAEFQAKGAATMIRESVRGLEEIQYDLTAALVASQDRIQAMKALARINVQGLASEETIQRLLDESLLLTGTTLIVLFAGIDVTATSGDASNLDERCAVALTSVEDDPHSLIRNRARDRAMICTLDPDGEGDHFVAFFRDHGRPFSTTDVPLIEAIVSALGLMLAFNELHQSELRQAQVQREHQLASALAQSAISERYPESRNFDIFAQTVPAAITGGDFYVFGETDGGIWFAVGDVAGKGLPAAMIMTRAVAACRVAFLANRDLSVPEVFTRIEEELYDHLDEVGVFVTLVVGVIDEATKTVSLVNAGHSPVVDVQGPEARFIPASAPPLGVVRGKKPAVALVEMGPGRVLLVGSDGLTEQLNPQDEMFGYDRFRELCSVVGPASASGAGSAIVDAVADFAAGCAASDDATIVVIKGTHT
jgi:serine phosphatase RsbU (regulator of sigma subunit)